MVRSNKLVAGLLFGAAAGLLLAPKPGKESRHVVASRLDQPRHKAGNRVRTLRRIWPEERDSSAYKNSSEQRVGIPG
jgi:gas vesicle protein